MESARWKVRENDERWKDLCAQAAKEQDPVKLQELVTETTLLLEAKQKRLGSEAPAK